MIYDKDVEKWLKRTERKGPYYLVETQKMQSNGKNFNYVVIWNDGSKTKLGSFHDEMYCRYGVQTRTVLNGETPFDLWNGAGITETLFEQMLAVRNGKSDLSHFDLHTIKGLKH